MRRLIRRACAAMGMYKWYHVAGVFSPADGIGNGTLSMTCRMSPWLHHDNYKELATFMQKQPTNAKPGSVVITSITEIGF